MQNGLKIVKNYKFHVFVFLEILEFLRKLTTIGAMAKRSQMSPTE